MNRLDYEKAVNHYAAMVYRIAFSYTNSKYDAEDILQEVFLKLLQTNTDFSDEEHVKHWLVRVTINQGKNLHKSFWKRNVDVSEPGTFEPEWKEEKEQRLYEELQQLPGKYRVMLHLYYFEGYKIREIAQMFHMRASTVNTRIDRGRKLLREMLEEDEKNGCKENGYERKRVLL